jgi:hypothetical protein
MGGSLVALRARQVVDVREEAVLLLGRLAVVDSRYAATRPGAGRHLGVCGGLALARAAAGLGHLDIIVR